MKVKTQVDRRPDPEVILLADTVGVKAGAVPTLTTGPVKPADLLALSTTAKDAYINEAELAAALAAAREARIAAMVALKKGINSFAQHAEVVLDFDAEALKDIGFSMRKKGTLLGTFPKPLNLSSEPGEMEATILVKWDPIGIGRPTYFLECAQSVNGPWTLTQAVTTASAVCTGLTPGGEYFFRVRAHGAAGYSAYSDITRAHAQW